MGLVPCYQAVCQWCFCLGLLFLPAFGLDVDSGDCVLFWWRCGVCTVLKRTRYICVMCVLSFWLLDPFCIFIVFFAPMPRVHSSVWVSAAVGLLLVWKACAGVLSFFSPPLPKSISKVVVMGRSSWEEKTNVLSDLSTCLFQEYTHGFLLINLLFALSYFLCHNSCLFSSVLVVWTVHASFRVYFQVATTDFFYVFNLLFLRTTNSAKP